MILNSHTRAKNKQLKLDVYTMARSMFKDKQIHSFESQCQCLGAWVHDYGPGDTETSGQMSPDTGQTSPAQSKQEYLPIHYVDSTSLAIQRVESVRTTYQDKIGVFKSICNTNNDIYYIR